MELGKKIKQLRLKAGLTQNRLAEKLGIGAQSVSKWENGIAMPDITTLPLLAEVFGVSIDDMFDLSTEQRFNRIENRLDAEEELPQDVFWEYEEFLKNRLTVQESKKRATELIAYLYWHRMETYARKASRFAKEAVRLSPNEKGCRWILNKAAGHAAWDWNMNNHANAVDFCREIVEANPDSRISYLYLMDNLIADRRADEAEECLKKLCALKDSDPVISEVYRAHIALARFDEKTADGIIEKLLKDNPNSFAAVFEAAQYFAGKCDYARAIECYENSFENEPRRPRFTDELYAIADIYKITGDYEKAAQTYDRIIDLLKNEWGMTEEITLADAIAEKVRLLEKAKN